MRPSALELYQPFYSPVVQNEAATAYAEHIGDEEDDVEICVFLTLNISKSL